MFRLLVGLLSFCCPLSAAIAFQSAGDLDAVKDALKKRNHQSIGSLVNASLESLGEDSEDMALRKRMCGLINTLAEEGVIVRHMDGNREVFSLPE